MTIKTAIIPVLQAVIGLDIARGFLGRGSNIVMSTRDGEILADAAQKLGGEKKIALVPVDGGYAHGRA
jgi:NADP-dependent 3-hydroxy acid dehydrogenase YdfG